MTDLRAKQMEGEQWVFEPRTADPPTTETGERWLRVDLNSGDKIATLRVDVGSSIRDVPIFATGTAVDTVSEAMRVQVNGMTGYVPIAPVADAAYPELRMQHNSQVHGYHDRVEPGSAIADSDVYLHDDWGDNKLQNRDESGTTTYNDVEGIYRPEWTLDLGTPTAANQQLELGAGEGVYAGINLDLSSTITWTWSNVDLSGSGLSGADIVSMQCFAESTTRISTGGAELDDGYAITMRRDGDVLNLATGGGAVVSGSLSGVDISNFDISVTRSSGGTWELFADATSQGTGTDTTFTNPQYIAFGTRDENTALNVNQVKVA